MTSLILLVVAAAWLAVLLPPMLRSRSDNRPNSSVTDFRRQLTKLENTATPPRGAVRAMGRPLTQSPLSRPVAAGRPAQPVLRSGVTRRPTASELEAQRLETVAPQRSAHVPVDAPRYRTHGDPTGGQRRPQFDDDRTARIERPQRRDTARRDTDGRQAPQRHAGRRTHGDPTGGQRRPSDSTVEIKRRRSNILFVLGVTAACTLLLAATTASDFMLYVFVVALLALLTYIYLLAQQNGGSRLSASERLQDSWGESY